MIMEENVKEDIWKICKSYLKGERIKAGKSETNDPKQTLQKENRKKSKISG